MKQTYHYIKDAWLLLRRKKYSDATVVLDRIIHAVAQDPYPLLLKALACLYQDKFNEVNLLMQKISSIDPAYRPYVQLKAFLELKSAINSESALNSYLDVIEKFPDDEFLLKARKALSYATDFKKWQKQARIQDYVSIPKPPAHLLKLEKEKYKIQKNVRRAKTYSGRTASVRRKRLFRSGKLVKVAIVLGMAALVFLGWHVFFNNPHISQPGKRLSAQQFENVDKIYLSDNEFSVIQKVNTKTVAFFYYSSQNLKDDFYAAKKLIKQGQYNRALHLLNKINNSNVNVMTKEKVEFLIRFVMHIEERDFEAVDYKVIKKASYLYRGYGIRLHGKVTNLYKKPESLTFTLLVNYKSGEVFAGSVEVFYNSLASIGNGDAIELHGIYISTLGNGERGYVTAKAIKKL